MTASKATWTRHVGDVADTIQIQMSAALGDDLSAVASVSAVARDRVTGAESALVAAVSDSTNRVVTVTLGAWLQSTVVAGDCYYISLTVVTTDARTITFPESLSKRPTIQIV